MKRRRMRRATQLPGTRQALSGGSSRSCSSGGSRSQGGGRLNVGRGHARGHVLAAAAVLVAARRRQRERVHLRLQIGRIVVGRRVRGRAEHRAIGRREAGAVTRTTQLVRHEHRGGSSREILLNEVDAGFVFLGARGTDRARMRFLTGDLSLRSGCGAINRREGTVGYGGASRGCGRVTRCCGGVRCHTGTHARRPRFGFWFRVVANLVRRGVSLTEWRRW
mmetsp:Transcript_37961/g.95428  ORF Transcript_37961/g.95428 Transcript_37961/m.95428 type:complete len:221 (-) Transcript_37961:1240-1902(-)